MEAYNDPIAAYESEYVNTVQHTRPHPPAGLSKHAAGVGTQILVHHFPKLFDSGMMERGIAFHNWYYQNHPVGMIMDIPNASKYMIFGIEQIVLIFDVDGLVLRQSYIDVLMKDMNTHKLEFWDLKNNAGAENKTERDPEYEAQLNLYAYLWKRQLGLPYLPTCRILISDPMNWNKMKVQSFTMDPTLGEWSMNQIIEYETFKNRSFGTITRSEWLTLIAVCSTKWKTGRLYYTKDDGKQGYRNTTYRVTCSRCDNWEKCVEKLGLQKDHDMLLEDPDFFKRVKT